MLSLDKKKSKINNTYPVIDKAKQKNMCVYGHIKKPIYFFTIDKTGNSRYRFQNFIFEISGKPSFVEAVL